MADETAVLGRETDTTPGAVLGGAIDVDLPPVASEQIAFERRIIVFAEHLWSSVRRLIVSIIWLCWVVVGWILQLLVDGSPILTQLYFTDSMKAEFQPFNPYA